MKKEVSLMIRELNLIVEWLRYSILGCLKFVLSIYNRYAAQFCIQSSNAFALLSIYRCLAVLLVRWYV